MVHLFSSKPDIIKVRNQGVEGRFLRCKCLDFKHLLIFADIKLCTSWWFTLAVFRQRLKWFPDERYLCPVLYLVIWKRLRDTDYWSLFAPWQGLKWFPDERCLCPVLEYGEHVPLVHFLFEGDICKPGVNANAGV